MQTPQPTQAATEPPGGCGQDGSSQVNLTPGAILASPQGRERLTIADVYVSPSGRATVRYLAGDVLWTWPLHPTARVLSEMGFRFVGEEDAEVLAERVKLADSRARRRFDQDDSAAAQGGAA